MADRQTETSLICCPRCKSALTLDLVCSNPDCRYARQAFFQTGGQPVLIDFETSIFEASSYQDGRGSVMARDDSGRGWRRQLQRLLIGTNKIAPRQAIEFCRRIKRLAERPAVLVVGGGAIGLGKSPKIAVGFNPRRMLLCPGERCGNARSRASGPCTSRFLVSHRDTGSGARRHRR